ncbi:Antibiotic biosynthesis monooxygenase [Planctomycetes bacterium Pan216]|uniref:Antibiotic biosynthesis monooxygenase n=1 Tax=Kolteria novifilia TaxID=2527975 RepID=A0A518BBK1_9BACT|nr:Antibiotic biosynthesis monooxygenase [Planctomycetes bacterium Pan216]
MFEFAADVDPPYYAVIFTSLRRREESDAYEQMAARMLGLAAKQPGYLGVESVRDPSRLGITVSYWKDLASIKAWKAHADHLVAQELGRSRWYEAFRVRICRVESERSMSAIAPTEP